jgi:hypothetical protein
MWITSSSGALWQLLCVVCETFVKQHSPGNRDEFMELFLKPGGDKNNHGWWFAAVAIFWTD